jgi:nucleoside-triphosphatase THEP1
LAKHKYKNLNPVWTKAALLGSIWGSIEIIVGSLLHNLRIPVTGTILSAMGVSLLVGGYFLWKEKGIIWRAGVVCALMKSISPSAVILGPMIGIITEALVLEIIISLSRGTKVGLLIGGAITTCLPFIQNIINLIITYGFNIAILYVEAYKFAVKNIGITRVNAYDAIGILFSLYAIFGACAAMLGISVGKRAGVAFSTTTSEIENKSVFTLNALNSTSKFSIPLLVSNIIGIPLMLFAISELSLIWSSIIVVVYVACAVIIYPNAWKRFSRPKIWIELIAITTLAGLLLGGITNKGSGWSWTGLIVGVQMSLRASFMVAVFNIISVELRNPKIIEWFLRIGFGQLAAAMEVAFEALPAAISALGDQRNVLRHPITSLSRLLLVAKNRLAVIEKNLLPSNKIFILTGDKGSGKTTLLTELVNEFQMRELRLSGIISPVVYKESTLVGFDVVDIQNQNRIPLCRISSERKEIKVGDFKFFGEGISFGNNALDLKNLSDCKLVIIDEVGPLELEGKGWAASLDRIINNLSCPLLLVVRESLLEKVKERWKFVFENIWKISPVNKKEILEGMIKVLIKS